ncbi:TcpJ [Clostridium perfringens]|uniref:TcpJ n=1 Tax=Clostridium perfringens TaxID=1502 RepID=UPI001ABA7A4C|nr:TcpJ [Clostridium perfringens]ELC8371377.1 TcpJ [Clostridium perfringens]MBO3304741.1 TcpJ [Clostridium perfringens]MBO3308069.1 TcpJ [Clostridium perfringens]MBO3311400.1 TcpJ [Clostridium perfringens]MBO3317746.1 TcpJ [Clostridium perfringens]
MKKKLVFLGLICLSLFAFVGCGTEKLDISNCIDVRYGEFNGSAKIYESSLDLGKLQDIPKLKGLTPDMLKGDYKITLVGDKTDLKNGDKVKLHLEYNKELYKRDFNVEFKFEPTEVTIEGLPDKLTDINQISKEQWEKIYSAANKYFENIAKEKNFNNFKLERILKFEDNNTGKIDIGFIYSYKSNNNELSYICLNDSLKFKVDNELEYNNFSINLALDSIWFNKFFIDYSKPLNEILNNIYTNVYKCKYSILWSAEN